MDKQKISLTQQIDSLHLQNPLVILSAKFTAKFRLDFVLTLENAFS